MSEPDIIDAVDPDAELAHFTAQVEQLVILLLQTAGTQGFGSVVIITAAITFTRRLLSAAMEQQPKEVSKFVRPMLANLLLTAANPIPIDGNLVPKEVTSDGATV